MLLTLVYYLFPDQGDTDQPAVFTASSASHEVRRPWEKTPGNGTQAKPGQVNGSESPKPMRK